MKQQTQKTKRIALMGILSALLILMAFTPIGYLKIGAISISFLMIPVALGAIALGPVAGAALGTLFGITSFAQCFGMDPFGTFLMSINPFFTFVMCIVARALAGFLTGLVANAFRRLTKNDPLNSTEPIAILGHAVTGLCAALFNTLLFMGTLLAFFWHNHTFLAKMEEWGITTATLGKFLVAFVGINAILEAVAAFFITGAIGTALDKAKLIRKFDEKASKKEKA